MDIFKFFIVNTGINNNENIYSYADIEECFTDNYIEVELSFFTKYWYVWVMLMFFTMLIVIYIYIKKTVDYRKIISEKNSEIEQHKKNRTDLERREILQKEISVKAMKAKNLILKNMGHEIRTPLNSIISICDIAQLSDLTLKQKNYIEDIKILANNLNLTINEIIEYSKIESGDKKLDANRFNLEELLLDLISTLIQSAYRKGIEIAYHISNDVPINIKSDKGKLSQVLISLISNAIKYTDIGYVYIKIDVKKSDGNRYVLTFKIIDTGKGISVNKEDIFILETSTSQITYNYSSTGIGLPIAKRFINLMDGDITYKSCHNKGTEFTFTIAVEEVKFDFIDLTERNKLKNKKILFIYENTINQTVLSKILKEKEIVMNEVKKDEIRIKLNNEVLNEIDMILYEKNNGEILTEFYEKISFLNYDKNKIILLVNPIELFEEDASVKEKPDYIIKPIKKHEIYNKLENKMYNSGSKNSNKRVKLLKRKEVKELQNNSGLNIDEIYESQKEEKNSKNKNLKNTYNNSGPSILVVEDNETNRLTITTLLLKKGYNIIEATDGKEAVEAYEKYKNIELVLMDIQMPIMNGYEATEIILEKSKQDNRKIDIIAVTAYVTSTDKERCFQLGMSDYLTKPYNFIELYEKISNYI